MQYRSRARARRGTGTPLGSLVQLGGFFPQVFQQFPDSTTRTRPTGDLGPRYRVAYRVPGPSGTSTIVQDVYPYAKPAGDVHASRPALLGRQSHPRRLVRFGPRPEDGPRRGRTARVAAPGSVRRIVPVGMDGRRRPCRGRPTGPRAAPARSARLPDAEKYRLNDDNPPMQTPGEEALVERACRGDPAAFEDSWSPTSRSPSARRS